MREGGISGQMATTASQNGMMGKIVSWVESAYNDIQARHSWWEFLRDDFSFDCVTGTSEYTPVAAGIDDFNAWGSELFRVYLGAVDDEQWMDRYAWADFRDICLFAGNRTVQGRPVRYTFRPNKSLVLWPVPDDEYTVSGEYYKRPAEMTANTDEPLFPQQFHLAIVLRGLMFLAADQEALPLYQHAEKEFKRLMFALENDQLPSGCGDVEPLA